jgi:uncharacterized membrane protein
MKKKNQKIQKETNEKKEDIQNKLPSFGRKEFICTQMFFSINLSKAIYLSI